MIKTSKEKEPKDDRRARPCRDVLLWEELLSLPPDAQERINAGREGVTDRTA